MEDMVVVGGTEVSATAPLLHGIGHLVGEETITEVVVTMMGTTDMNVRIVVATEIVATTVDMTGAMTEVMTATMKEAGLGDMTDHVLAPLFGTDTGIRLKSWRLYSEDVKDESLRFLSPLIIFRSFYLQSELIDELLVVLLSYALM